MVFVGFFDLMCGFYVLGTAVACGCGCVFEWCCLIDLGVC